MPQQGRRDMVRSARIGGIVALLIGILTACAGPGGDGLSTISAASTAGGALTTITPGGTRAASTGSAAASTGTTASNTVAAAVGSSVASPGAAGSAAARTPAVAGSVASGSAVSIGSRPAGAGSAPAGSVTTGNVTTGSAASGTRPATSGSATAGVASAASRTVTTGATTAGSAGTATRVGAAGTTTASTSANTAMIPPPPGAIEYVKGTNPVIDTILQGAGEGLNSSSDTVTVTSSKNYTTPSSASDVVTFYQMQMPKLGWTSEQNQEASSGITTLVYSRDNKTNAALLLVVDLAQIGQKGCLVITALATPK